MTKKNTVKKPTTPIAPPADAPKGQKLTLAMIELMRDADSLDSAVRILQPTARPKVDATYVVNANATEPLPAKRGVGLRVLATAVRINAPFKVADITNALPDAKAAKYWVGRLVRSGHLTPVAE